MKWIRGHSTHRSDRHVLSEVDATRRSALCSRCGPVTIKRSGERWRCTTKISSKHSIVEFDVTTKTGWCLVCKERVGVRERGRFLYCKRKLSADVAAWRKDNPGRVKAAHAAWREANRENLRTTHRKRIYGLEAEDYDRMLVAQQGRCAICRREPTGKPRDKVLHVDRDHATGNVRGLLCHDCNKGIGCFREDGFAIRAAIHYLDREHVVPPPPA